MKSNRKSQEQFGLLFWITPAGVNKPLLFWNPDQIWS